MKAQIAGRRWWQGCLLHASLPQGHLAAFCIAMFNQLSGINAILYYAPRS